MHAVCPVLSCNCWSPSTHNLHNKEKLPTYLYLTRFTQLHCDTKYALKSFRALCVDLEAVYLYTVLDQN